MDHFYRRASSLIVRDVPIDLANDEALDPLGLLRGRVLAEVKRAAEWNRGSTIARRRPVFSVPSSPQTTRQTSQDGHRSFHFSKNETVGRSADSFDSYATADRGSLVKVEPGGRPATAFDDYARSHGDGERHTTTTLDQDPDIRSKQWRAIEAYEIDQRVSPEAGLPRINVCYDRDPIIAQRVVNDPRCPAGLSTLITSEVQRVAAGRPLSKRKAEVGVAWIDPSAPATIAWINAMAKATASPSPDIANNNIVNGPLVFKLSMGRRCQTVLAGDGEFPKELDADACRRVLEGLRAFVLQVAGIESGSPKTVPLILVKHSPDDLNHPDNRHFHWQMGCRVVTMTGDNLEFAPTKVPAFTRKDWLQRMRDEVARLTNIELAEIDAVIRLHPGTNAELKIAGGQMTKLHGAQTVVERAGIPTAIGVRNAEEGWRRAFQQAETDFDLDLERIGIESRRLMNDRNRTDDEARFKDEEASARTDRETAAHLRHEAAQIEILIAMARSRAEQTVRFGPAYERKAERNGGANSYDARSWRLKTEGATDYLHTLDVELQLERDEVASRLSQATILEGRASARVSAFERRSTQFDVEEGSPPSGREGAPLLQEKPGHVDLPPSPSPSPSPHRAVDLIAGKPLLISKVNGLWSVANVDDREGLVTGVDLSAVQKRLAVVRKSQRTELRQLDAYMTKHGPGSLSNDRLKNADPWIKRTAAKWADTPVIQRLIEHHQSSVKRPRSPDPMTDRRAERKAASSAPVNTSAAVIHKPDFHGVRVHALDPASGKPSRSLLLFIKHAGEQPDTVGLASDGKMTDIGNVPPFIKATIDQSRNDMKVHGLIIETVTRSKEAGRPVYPEPYATAIHGLTRTAYGTSRRGPAVDRGIEMEL